jgi:plastocyanin
MRRPIGLRIAPDSADLDGVGIRILAWSAAALLLAPVAWAGVVDGKVALTPADLGFRGGVKPNAYVGQLSGHVGHAGSVVASDSVYGVAYVADIVGEASRPSGVALLDQSGQRFVPRILAVVVGQQVEFRNSDNVFHNVFSYSPPKRFDLGRYPRGKSKTLTFQKPGLVQVFCDIHSNMRADVVVVPNRFFAYVNAEGTFRLEGVPAGDHELTIWLPLRGERTLDVTVPEAGNAAVSISAE